MIRMTRTTRQNGVPTWKLADNRTQVRGPPTVLNTGSCAVVLESEGAHCSLVEEESGESDSDPEDAFICCPRAISMILPAWELGPTATTSMVP